MLQGNILAIILSKITLSDQHKFVLSHSNKLARKTVSTSHDLHNIMKEHAVIRWSEVARQAFIQLSDKEKLRIANKIAKKSKLTAKDAQIIADKIKKKRMAERLRRDYNTRH